MRKPDGILFGKPELIISSSIAAETKDKFSQLILIETYDQTDRTIDNLVIFF
jgi:hypothetical protein